MSSTLRKILGGLEWLGYTLFFGCVAAISEKDGGCAMALLLGWLLYEFVRWSRKKGVRWGEIGAKLFLLLFTYFVGLSMLGGDQTWHHLFALPVGFFFLWLMSRR